jgi:hypothetical protein
MPLQEGKLFRRYQVKRTLKRISLLLVVMAVTVNLCSFTTVFADDGMQTAIASNAQPTAFASNLQPISLVKNVQLRSAIGVLPVYYRVVNVKTLAPEWLIVGVADGIPTMALVITRSKRIAVTYSATFGATYGQINTAVGWTYGQDVTIAIAGHYTIPKTYNGRKVRSGTLIAYAEIGVKSYQVERHNEVGGITINTGTARKAENHLRYKVILYYTDGGSTTISV